MNVDSAPSTDASSRGSDCPSSPMCSTGIRLFAIRSAANLRPPPAGSTASTFVTELGYTGRLRPDPKPISTTVPLRPTTALRRHSVISSLPSALSTTRGSNCSVYQPIDGLYPRYPGAPSYPTSPPPAPNRATTGTAGTQPVRNRDPTGPREPGKLARSAGWGQISQGWVAKARVRASGSPASGFGFPGFRLRVPRLRASELSADRRVERSVGDDVLRFEIGELAVGQAE